MARVKGPDISRMMPAEQVQQMIASLPADVRPQVEAAIQLFKLGLPFNLDSWDGYPAGRERLYETFAAAGVSPVVLAGDSHAFWVNELHDNAGARRAVEFGTSSISSPSPGDHVGGLPLGAAGRPGGPRPEVRTWCGARHDCAHPGAHISRGDQAGDGIAGRH